MRARHILPLVVVAAVAAGLSLKPLLGAPSPLAGDVAEVTDPLQGTSGNNGLTRQALGRLHLTAEQKKAGLVVLRSHQPAIKPLVDSLAKERAGLLALTKAPTVDESAIRAQSARAATVEADLAVQRAYLAHDLRALATPEQLQTLDKMQAENASRQAEMLQRFRAWVANS